jgi:hypothetical protein
MAGTFHPVPTFACCYNDEQNLLASGGANGFFSIQMILRINGLQYHTVVLRAQLAHPVSSLAWISSNMFPLRGSLAIGLRSGLIQKLDFLVDNRNNVSFIRNRVGPFCSITLQIRHVFVPMYSFPSAVVSLAHGLNDLLVISASGQYCFINVADDTGYLATQPRMPTNKAGNFELGTSCYISLPCLMIYHFRGLQ